MTWAHTMRPAGQQTHYNYSGHFQSPPRGSLGPQETTKQYYKRKNTKQSLKKKSCQCGARGRGGCPGHRCGAKSRADEAPGLPHGHLSARPARAGHAVATAPLGAPLSTLGEVERPLESAYTRGGARGEAGSRRASRLGGRLLGAQTRRGAGRKRGACACAGGAGYRGASGAAIPCGGGAGGRTPWRPHQEYTRRSRALQYSAAIHSLPI